MTCPLCNDTGEQRYWEGRWRDERIENERLRQIEVRARQFVICQTGGNQIALERALDLGHQQTAQEK